MLLFVYLVNLEAASSIQADHCLPARDALVFARLVLEHSPVANAPPGALLLVVKVRGITAMTDVCSAETNGEPEIEHSLSVFPSMQDYDRANLEILKS